jgi:hypothetical protein
VSAILPASVGGAIWVSHPLHIGQVFLVHGVPGHRDVFGCHKPLRLKLNLSATCPKSGCRLNGVFRLENMDKDRRVGCLRAVCM